MAEQMELASLAEIEGRLAAMALVTCEPPDLSDVDHGLPWAAKRQDTAPEDFELRIPGLDLWRKALRRRAAVQA